MPRNAPPGDSEKEALFSTAYKVKFRGFQEAILDKRVIGQAETDIAMCHIHFIKKHGA
jgi:hypothetical protein